MLSMVDCEDPNGNTPLSEAASELASPINCNALSSIALDKVEVVPVLSNC